MERQYHNHAILLKAHVHPVSGGIIIIIIDSSAFLFKYSFIELFLSSYILSSLIKCL